VSLPGSAFSGCRHHHVRASTSAAGSSPAGALPHTALSRSIAMFKSSMSLQSRSGGWRQRVMLILKSGTRPSMWQAKCMLSCMGDVARRLWASEPRGQLATVPRLLPRQAMCLPGKPGSCYGPHARTCCRPHVRTCCMRWNRPASARRSIGSMLLVTCLPTLLVSPRTAAPCPPPPALPMALPLELPRPCRGPRAHARSSALRRRRWASHVAVLPSVVGGVAIQCTCRRLGVWAITSSSAAGRPGRASRAPACSAGGGSAGRDHADELAT
jgi:hypothetical protein